MAIRHAHDCQCPRCMPDGPPHSPVAFAEARKEAWNGGVQVTAGQFSHQVPVLTSEPFVSEKVRQSLLPHRPSVRAIWFSLTPWGTDWADDFIMGKETVGYTNPNTPRGRLSTMDDRRNVGIPPRVSYGAKVGESDGVSAYPELD